MTTKERQVKYWLRHDPVGRAVAKTIWEFMAAGAVAGIAVGFVIGWLVFG